MKNLISAAGALSLGAAGLVVSTNMSAAEGGDKPWTASAALRGFYDDNIFTRPAGPLKVDSWGFELSPSLGYERSIDNTSFSVGYTYLARWYEARSDSKWDQNHSANLKLDHTFNPRLKLAISDEFVSAQDPEQFAPLTGLVQRAEGDNINNTAAANLTLGLTDRLSAVLGYRNGIYDYSFPFYAAALNRMEHLPSADLRFLLNPSTALIAGYQYGIFDYDLVNRDYNSHYIYGGIDHQFLQNFSGSLTAGAQVTDYDLGNSDTTPYLNGNLSYQYSPGSSAMLGVKHAMVATDVVLASNQEATAFYVRWTHAFTAKLKGTLHGQFQSADFNSADPVYNGRTENYWTMGVSASYSLTAHVALEASYYYDKLDSDLDSVDPAISDDRGYGRNRVFVGVRASF